VSVTASSSKELESGNVFSFAAAAAAAAAVAVAAASYFGIWLARFKSGKMYKYKLFYEFFYPSSAVSRKGCTGIDTWGRGCTVLYVSKAGVLYTSIYWLPSSFIFS